MKKGLLITVLLSSFVVSLFASDYIIAAERFEYTRGQTTNAVTDATTELIPQQILSNMNSQLMRSVLPDEQLERSRYKSRQERYSIYLQLSSEYKKRDALFLDTYQDSELKLKIDEQNKKIHELEEKINSNIQDQKEIELDLLKKSELFSEGVYTRENTEKSELQKYSSLVRNLFVQNENLVSIENIKFYKDDKNAFYAPAKASKEAGYTNPIFENEIMNSKINALITGKITSYGNYNAVTVKVYTYPGAKLIGTVTEVGSKNELDFICANIARQLVPILTNSMKVNVSFEIEPSTAPYQVYVDDLLQKNITDNLILDSGVHKIQIVADGYKSVSIQYYFDGNENFKVQANLVEIESTNLKLTLINPVPGTIYANSIPGIETEAHISEISINGSHVIGNFVDENGLTSFYYIPQNKMISNELLYIKSSVKDKDKYIDTRRKWMYAGYSSLMVSLIPTLFTSSQYSKYADLYNNKHTDFNTAKAWEAAWIGCTAISIAAGVFWGVELVRYLLAANEVIPEVPQPDKNGKFQEKQKKNIERAEKSALKKNDIENKEIESTEQNTIEEVETESAEIGE